MYSLQPSDEFLRRQKRFDKKHHDELLAVLDNLDTFKKGLDGGLKLEQVRNFGFIHVEPQRVLAIDQKGGGHGAKLAQTRLYVYVDKINLVIYLLTLGDKSTQHEDIKFSCDFAKELHKEEEDSHGQE